MQFSNFLIFRQLLSVYANSIQLSYIFNLFVHGTLILKTYFYPKTISLVKLMPDFCCMYVKNGTVSRDWIGPYIVVMDRP